MPKGNKLCHSTLSPRIGLIVRGARVQVLELMSRKRAMEGLSLLGAFF